MAGGSALGYGLPERETFRMLPLISFRILIFYAEEKCHMLPLFPGSDIQDSTFHHLINQMAPMTADWGMRYVRRLPEKLICKLEPGR